MVRELKEWPTLMSSQTLIILCWVSALEGAGSQRGKAACPNAASFLLTNLKPQRNSQTQRRNQWWTTDSNKYQKWKILVSSSYVPIWTALERLQIRHTRLTHGWLTDRSPHTTCIGCQEPLSVANQIPDTCKYPLPHWVYKAFHTRWHAIMSLEFFTRDG